MAAGRLVLLSLSLCLFVPLSPVSCAGPPDPVPYARAYPGDLPRALPLDIQVFRGDKSIEFTNTTARTLPAATLWLNGYYGLPTGPIAIGETVTYRLADFRSEFSEKFRGGGFFAADEPMTLILAEFEVPADSGGHELVGLIVVQPE